MRFLTLAVVACGGDNGTEPGVQLASVEVSATVDTVVVRTGVQLTATARDAAGRALTGTVFTWSSSDSALATVSAAGTVATLALGTVTLSATSGGQSGSVILALVPAIALTPRLPSLVVNDTTLVVATLTDAIGVPLTGTVVFSSDNPAIATVDAGGVVSGHALGAVRIIAASNGGTAAADVIVLPNSRPNREIAMQRDANRFDGKFITEVWTIRPDGSGFTRVSEAEENVTQYIWSPDGSKIGMNHVRGAIGSSPMYGRSGLFAADATGANITEVASGDARSPTWSSDNQTLAYFTAVGGSSSNTRIVRRNWDGAGQVLLTNGSAIDVNPQWSPDGRQIAWRVGSPVCAALWVMDSNGSNKQRLVLPFSGCSVAWSPDAKQLAVASSSGIWLVNRDGTGARPLISTCTMGGGCPVASGPVWAPDGSRLAYLSGGTDGIVVTERDGTGSFTITISPACCSHFSECTGFF